MYRRTALLLLAFLFGLSVSASDDRVPTPPPDAIAKASKLVRELFKDDFAKTTPKARVALAEKLLKQAEETPDDPAAQYVLYKEAAELAASGNDIDLSLLAIDGLRSRFDGVKVDQLEVLFRSLASKSNTVESNFALTSYLMRVVDDAVVADDLDAAGRIVKLAETTSLKAKSGRAFVLARGKEIDAFKKDVDKVKAALTKLEKVPSDAESSTVVGQYHCFQKGDWTKGLILLAAGNDAKLKAVAEKEIGDPKEPSELLAVADAWYDLGQAATGPAKRAILSRSLSFYSRCADDLAGLSKSKAEKRMVELENVDGRAAHEELWPFVRAAVKAKDVDELIPIGGAFGRKDYREAPDNAVVLVGFNYATRKFGNHDVIDFLQPIWLTASGEKLGALYGRPDVKPQTMKAKPGYAIAAIKVRGGGWLEGFSVTYMRIQGKGLTSKGSYESAWVGRKLENDSGTQVGDTRPVVGLHGKLNDRDNEMCSIGLIVAGEKSKKK